MSGYFYGEHNWLGASGSSSATTEADDAWHVAARIPGQLTSDFTRV